MFARLLLAASLLLLPAMPAAAHELLPEQIIQIMAENPDFTAEDIDALIEKVRGIPADQPLDVDAAIEAMRLGADEDASLWEIIWTFILLGIEHILGGFDHVLFVLSLLLVFTNLKHILKLVTAFTLAHTVTFLLAGFGLLVLPPRVVEPLIALSIAYVAVTTVFFPKMKWLGDPKSKVGAVFFFGLFHGLGFAGLLADFRIPEGNFLASLISFNVGIEVGQILILGLLVPYILLLRHKAWYPTLIKVVAIAITQLAALWAFERVFGLSFMPF